MTIHQSPITNHQFFVMPLALKTKLRLVCFHLRMPALTALLVLTLLSVAIRTSASTSSPVEALYRRGILPSGQLLRGERQGGGLVQGNDAACVNCHQRSGFGGVEGRIVVPPITASYLFRPSDRNPEHAVESHIPATPFRAAYTDSTLARAIREGIDPNGRHLDYLMPRYKLDDQTMAVLIEYLKGLSKGPVPGVTEDTLHFATIITPDADPVARKGMLDVMEHYFAARNASYLTQTPPYPDLGGVTRPIPRQWRLHVWQLAGPPESWEEQLGKRLRAEPVLAVISGLGGKTWAPVHQFCEQESLPCLFPNVELPVVAEDDFYPVYFSKGVLLEAELIAHRLREKPAGSVPRRIVQVYREDDIGSDAAKDLRCETDSAGFKFVDRIIHSRSAGQELADAVRDTSAGDAVVLWLRPEDLRSLPPEVPEGADIFFSGLMGGLENAPLPAGWRSRAHMTYPFDLPDARVTRMLYPIEWCRFQHVPLVAERIQADTYIACDSLAQNLHHMGEDIVRDYLVEQFEMMLSSRLFDGYYPRLELAPGQRFASKGGYIVHFARESGTQIAAEGGWIVP